MGERLERLGLTAVRVRIGLEHPCYSVIFPNLGVHAGVQSHEKLCCYRGRGGVPSADHLVRAVTYAGFHYARKESLRTPYAGRNPRFAGATWWERFFDYT
jgi:hypothetical protein